MTVAEPSAARRERVESPFHRGGRPEASPAAPARRSVPLPEGYELREMTGFEEEYLEAHLDEPNTAELCNQVLARCLVPPGTPAERALAAVRAMPTAHRDAALLELRRRSLGDAITTRAPCPACGEVNEVDFDLSQAPVEVAEVPARVEHRLSDGRATVLRLPNAGDQADLLTAGIASLAERRTWMLSRVLHRLGDGTGPFEPEAVRALPTRIRRELEQALDEATPASDLSLAIRCHACGHEFDAPFDAAGFFLPSSMEGR